jgi:hypothetical protein
VQDVPWREFFFSVSRFSFGVWRPDFPSVFTLRACHQGAGVFFFRFAFFLWCVAPRFPKRFYLARVPPGSGTGSWRHFFSVPGAADSHAQAVGYKYNKAPASLGYHSHLATKKMAETGIDLNVAPPLDENHGK